MKRMRNIWIVVMFIFITQVYDVKAQKIDDEKMQRDIEVAENVLATLIKHELNQQRGFFGLNITGTYLPGYGVTFRLPGDLSAPFMITINGHDNVAPVVWDGMDDRFSHSFPNEPFPPDVDDIEPETGRETRLKDKQKQKRRADVDSLRNDYNQKLISAAKDFILDYGDFISQLASNEKIVVTNQGDHNRGWYMHRKRTHLQVEGLKSDITAFKQGKINRDQALSKLQIINTESVAEKEPDMELLTSIFNRLYRLDLSKTFFTEDNIYYERLKDYGVVFYMQVYSSNQIDYNRFNMPTINLENIDQETRNKHVAELYPKFEKDIQENILEYGRTLKSLKDDELLVFNIALTKCKACGIPSSLELSVKSKVIKDYGAGKLDKKDALEKISIKKGTDQ